MAVLPAILLQLLQQQQGLLLLVSLFVSFLFLFRASRASLNKPNFPPSPPKLPIVGNFHQLGTLPHRSLAALSEKYGPLMLLHLGSFPTLVVSSANMAREIIKTQDLVFSNRFATKATNTFSYGCTDIAFSPYSEYWREVRKICFIKLLTGKRVKSFKFVREEKVATMMEEISRSCQLGIPVDIGQLMQTMTYSLISSVTVGRNRREKDGSRRLRNLIKEVLVIMGAFSMQDFFPFLGWIDTLTGFRGKIKKTWKELDAVLDQIIQQHLNSERNDGEVDEQDFVGTLLQAQKDLNLSRDNVKAVTLVSLSLSTSLVVPYKYCVPSTSFFHVCCWN
uniref:Cytochrome P450 71A1-like n=1 Tax=Nelumbo nucifera TaxID=4432 RepID=A0A822Z7Q3_NELNU|nr:TPA_asm: hypothetical protein HUJ06_008169 [Nelumbo nucifera]